MIPRLRYLADNITAYAQDGSVMVYYEGKLHLLGGWNSTQSPITNNYHYTIDPVALTITQLANAGWTRRHTFGAGVKDGKIWVWGDDNSFPGSYHRDVWTYDTVNGWVQVTSNWGSSVGDRQLAYYTVHNNYLYIAGGQGWGDIWRSADGITWSLVGDLPETTLESGVLVSYLGDLWLIGGGIYSTVTVPHYITNKAYKSTDGGATWTLMATDDRLKTYWCNGVATADGIFIIKGSDGYGTKLAGIIYSTDGVTWKNLSYSPLPRHATAMCADEDGVVYIAQGNLFNDLYKIIDISNPLP